MRLATTFLSLFICVVFGASSAEGRFGNVDISATWVPDPLVGGGGYVELSVANNSDQPVHIIAVGDNSVGVTYAATGLGAIWQSNIIPKGE